MQNHVPDAIGLQAVNDCKKEAMPALCKTTMLSHRDCPRPCHAGCGSSSHANASCTAALPSLIGDTACAGRTMSKSSAKMARSHLRDSCHVHQISGMSDTPAGREHRRHSDMSRMCLKACLGVLVVQRLCTRAEFVVEAVHLRDPLPHGAAGVCVIDLQSAQR